MRGMTWVLGMVIALSLTAGCDNAEKPVPLSSGCLAATALQSGWVDTQSGGKARTYYLRVPAGYVPGEPMPLVMAFHAFGGSGDAFVEDDYDLQSAVGEEAILVYPNALAGEDGFPNWNTEVDTVFFDDLYAELESNLCFNTGQVFVTGHSSGGGFTSQIGCDRGNIIRAIAPVAGALLDDSNCIGQVAVMQVQGADDELVPLSMVLPGKDYFVFYNGCVLDEEKAVAGPTPPCIEYGDCDSGFPVQYCLHEEVDGNGDGGHGWPTFGGDAIWDFFKNLEPKKQTDRRGSGAAYASMTGITTTVKFTVAYPDDFQGVPDKIALGLYEVGTRNPISDSPAHFLTDGDDVTEYNIGGQTEYEYGEANLTYVPVPGDYTLVVTMYLTGGNFPVPTWGTDYVGTVDIHIENYDDPIVVTEPIPVEILRFY